MVKAGPAVDEFIEHLIPLLSPGDVIIDGGNTYFHDTERRTQYVESKGLLLHRHRRLRRRGRRAEGAQHHARRQRKGLAAGQADLPGDLGQGRAEPRHSLLRMGRPARRRPLREDGPQRHRVRRHAVDLRGLLDPQECPGPDERRAVPGLRRLEPRRTGQLSDRDHPRYLLCPRFGDGGLPGRHHHGRRRGQGHGQMDEPVGPRPGRAQHAGDRGRLRPLPLGLARRPAPRVVEVWPAPRASTRATASSSSSRSARPCTPRRS